MRLELVQKQTQRLMMAPKMQQSLHILQLSKASLLEYLTNESMENPVIELDAAPVDTFADMGRNAVRRPEGAGDIPASKAGLIDTLEQHLLIQLNLAVHRENRELYGMVKYLIGNLEPSGYLRLPLEKAAADRRVPLEVAERALDVLQSFDPPGVGARDLRECLLLQLRQRTRPHPLAVRIVSDYLDCLAERKFREMAKALKCTPGEVHEAVRTILLLNPRPGAAFQQSPTVYAIPEVFIDVTDDGRLAVHVDRSGSSSVRINGFYENLSRMSGGQAGDYVKHCVESARWLRRCLEQRERTLQLVAEQIAVCQRDFFLYGRRHLVPLTMKEVAARTGLHESTVSRAVADKFAQTPQGVFALSFFFTSGIRKEDGGVSSESVKEKIKELVRSEPGDRPYSDQALTELLNEAGFAVSRRTVAKYREQLGIAPSAKRRSG